MTLIYFALFISEISVAKIHIKFVVNGDVEMESKLALILNTFGTLLQGMKFSPLQRAFRIINRERTRRQYPQIVKHIDKAKNDLKNIFKPSECSPEGILGDFLKFLINVGNQHHIKKWRIGCKDGIVILLEFKKLLTSQELSCDQMDKIKYTSMCHFQSIFSKSGKLSRGIPDFKMCLCAFEGKFPEVYHILFIASIGYMIF